MGERKREEEGGDEEGWRKTDKLALYASFLTYGT